MYYINGDDGTQYGPVSEVVLRSWIQEQRVNGEILVWEEGFPEWRRLGQHPVFEDSFSRGSTDGGAEDVLPRPTEMPSPSGCGVENDVQMGYVTAPGGGISASDFRSDEGPFIQLGKRFVCGGSSWKGPAVISPAALYLVKVSQGEVRTDGGGDGLAGVLVELAMNVALEAYAKRHRREICNSVVADLPHWLRTQFAPKQELASNPAVVIPKAVVSLVGTSKVNNLITVQVAIHRFKIVTSVLRFLTVPHKLEQLGWVLDRPLCPSSRDVQEWLQVSVGDS